MLPIVQLPSEGRDFWIWGDRYSFKAVGAETDGTFSLLEMTAAPGSGTPPHLHRLEDESFYVLEGELTIYAGDQRIAAPAGTFVAAPRGITHRWANESGAPVRVLVFIVPAGFEQFLMRIGVPVDQPYTPAPPTQQEIDAAVAIAGEYQMEIVA